jgi:catechol 2,3-dioxygenase-like lactoylglutathione lyase family enzyme
MFQRIDTVFVPTRNIEEAANWYVNILGGTLGWKSDGGEYQSIRFGGETTLTLFLTDDEMYFQPKRAYFNFYVPDVLEAHSYLKANDVKVEDVAEYGAKYFAFFDFDGNCLEVCEY